MSDATTEQPSYEEAREELIEVVRTLEAGGTTLEESLALWERGEALAKVCQQWLDGATETPGSWWPNWQGWAASLDGAHVPARQPGGGTLTPIEDAPGSYVTVRLT